MEKELIENIKKVFREYTGSDPYIIQEKKWENLAYLVSKYIEANYEPKPTDKTVKSDVTGLNYRIPNGYDTVVIRDLDDNVIEKVKSGAK